MPIRADQLREKEDYQKLILERLRDDNGFCIRPNTEYKPGLAMDTGMLLEFLESTQHDTIYSHTKTGYTSALRYTECGRQERIL